MLISNGDEMIIGKDGEASRITRRGGPHEKTQGSTGESGLVRTHKNL